MLRLSVSFSACISLPVAISSREKKLTNIVAFDSFGFKSFGEQYSRFMEGIFQATPLQFRLSPPKHGKMEFGLEEIHSTVSGPPEAEGSSFTALLELQPTQAMELLNNEDFQVNPMPPPIFPSNFAIVGRVPRLSTYASLENSPESRTIFPASSSMKLDFMKQESPESDSLPNSSSPAVSNQSLKPCKRKATEKKVKELNKKSKNPVSTEGFEANGEKPPYVHVRARRGQATNSHSLAERARREKINARMKLLQELVPGCDKISGTAMVLDEIINHVQALQRQVEFLSMRLAAVNPRVDFDLVAHLAAENGSSSDNSYRGMPDYSLWPEGHINVNGPHEYHQPLHMDGVRFHHPWWFREDTSNFIIPDHSLLNYDTPL